MSSIEVEEIEGGSSETPSNPPTEAAEPQPEEKSEVLLNNDNLNLVSETESKSEEAVSDSAPSSSVEASEPPPKSESLPPDEKSKMGIFIRSDSQLKKDEPVEDESAFDANPQVNTDDMKSAQEELNSLDILVCGACHNVFHFIQEFNKHKLNCRKKSNFCGNVMEKKPQVWAFLLWKNANVKVTRRGIPMEESSWKLYQKWCKMPERIRNAWVAAGETVMNFSTFTFNRNSEVPRRKYEKQEVSDKFKDDIESIRNQLEDDHFVEKEEPKKIHPEHVEPKDPTVLEPRLNYNRMRRVRDGDSAQQEEYVVEKIVSRRFNTRRKQYEYLIKWEGYPSEQNTWEPAENMETCKHLLKIFEDNIVKQTASKPGQKPISKRTLQQTTQPIASETTDPGPSGLNAYGRPVRTSKAKALSQVKAWCGSMKPDDMDDESEEEEVPGKRVKLEIDSDGENSFMGQVVIGSGGQSGIIKRGRLPGSRPVGRPPGRLLSNGTKQSDNLAVELGLESSGDEADGIKSKMNSLGGFTNKIFTKTGNGVTPQGQQVIVANAKGVVKVDPSQVSNLSSGVYIMSTQSGIIKLDASPTNKSPVVKASVPTSPQMTPSKPGSSVLMLKSGGIREGGAIQKSGIIRKNHGILKGGIPQVARNTPRPAMIRPAGNLKVEKPGARILGSKPQGVLAANKPKPVMQIPQRLDEKKILGPKSRPLPKTTVKGRTATPEQAPVEVNRAKFSGDVGLVVNSESDDSEIGLPDDFPMGDLPPLGPESPPRPLTLCPLTGKVLAKAEGEKTPEPTPPPSPPKEVPEQKVEITVDGVKQSYIEVPPTSTAYLNEMQRKDIMVKKMLKPGTIGSVTVSPKKSEQETESKEDDMVTITGDDGTVYKVSNTELSNSLLVSGEDGQQCVYVTTDTEDNTTVLTLDSSYADTVSQLGQVNMLSDADGTQFYVKESEDGDYVGLQVENESEEPATQVVAQLVEAGEPAYPGGPRRVVLLLPDGNLMVTEVDDDQFRALELDQ